MIAEAGQTLVQLRCEQGDVVRTSVIAEPKTGHPYMAATSGKLNLLIEIGPSSATPGAEIRPTDPENEENLMNADYMYSRRKAATR